MSLIADQRAQFLSTLMTCAQGDRSLRLWVTDDQPARDQVRRDGRHGLTVNRMFAEACRYIDSHSQPLASLNVSLRHSLASTVKLQKRRSWLTGSRGPRQHAFDTAVASARREGSGTQVSARFGR